MKFNQSGEVWGGVSIFFESYCQNLRKVFSNIMVAFVIRHISGWMFRNPYEVEQLTSLTCQ